MKFEIGAQQASEIGRAFRCVPYLLLNHSAGRNREYHKFFYLLIFAGWSNLRFHAQYHHSRYCINKNMKAWTLTIRPNFFVEYTSGIVDIFRSVTIQEWDNYYEIQKCGIFSFLTANPIYF